MSDVSISQRSQGAAPDSLKLALSGSTSLGEDFGRGVEVEVTLRGKVMGHGFDDKYDKHGDLEHTMKTVKLKVDELVEITKLDYRRKDDEAGQTTMPTEETTETPAAEDGQGEIVDADVVAELPPGAPDGVDPETGELTEGGDEGEAPDPEPDPDGGGEDEPPTEPEGTSDPDASSEAEESAQPEETPPAPEADSGEDPDLDWR